MQPTPLQFAATYDGRDATNHTIDMRRFGRALVGLDRMVSVGIIGIVERRVPDPRERTRVLLNVTEPRQGCVGIVGVALSVYSGMQPILPFILEQIREFGAEVIFTYLAASFNVLGGRSKDADPYIEKLIDLMDKINSRDAEDRLDEREALYKDRQREREFILKLIESVRPSAREVVGPLGQSASSLYFGKEFDDRQAEVDEPMAEAVRSKEPMEIGDVEKIQVRIDGLTKRNGRGSVERLDQPGRFIPIEIKDPRFGQPDNPYLNAFRSGEPLMISARAAHRDGEIIRLYVMDAEA